MVNPKHATPSRPNLMQPCMVCGEAIRSAKYHTVGGPGCVARGTTWPSGLFTHLKCRPGTAKWYKSLGTPVKNFAALFNAASDSLYRTLYSTVVWKKSKKETTDDNE